MTDNVEKSRVVERVDDWARRVEALYALVEHAVANEPGVSCDRTSHMTMHEELMHKHGVPPRQVPILDIRRNGRLEVAFKPIGLWVIGANGRIDILTEKGASILVDNADPMQPPKWTVYSVQDRKHGIPFDVSHVIELVRRA